MKKFEAKRFSQFIVFQKLKKLRAFQYDLKLNSPILGKGLMVVLVFMVSLGSVYAGHEIITELKKGEDIKTANIFVSDQMYRSQDTGFVTLSQGLALKLYFKDVERVYRAYNWDLKVYYSLNLRFNDGTSQTDNGNLNITGSDDKDAIVRDIDFSRFPGVAWANVEITSVVFENTDNQTSIGTLSNDFHFEASIISERLYNIPQSQAPTVTLEQYSISDNTLKIGWAYFQGAESYDLEWVFIADGDSTANHSTNSNIEYDFGNATRINLLNTEYALPMAFPKGSIIYRVRGVGYNIHKPEDYPKRMVGSHWSYQPSVFNLNQASTDNLGYFYTTGLNTDKNWTYTAVYAEEGKRKEVASYFDGSGRSRQQVTVQNTDNYAIIGETYYDYLGRGVVNVLPTPVVNQGVQFYGTAQNPFNGTFGPEQFATDDHLDENAAVIPLPLDSTANTSKYYSSNNSLDFVNKNAVPVGDGYNYTLTQYTNDGTERPKQQTGLGDEMKWQPQNSHTTKFFYTKPLQNDIDRLFGNEVGNAVFYQKVISIDPNGQQSVQYLDAKGRVMATGLAGEAPNQLDELDNKEEVVLKSKLFDSPKNVQGLDLVEAYTYFPSSLDPVKLVYNLNTSYMESCYQTAGNSNSMIKFDIKLKVSTVAGIVIDSLVLSNRSFVDAEDLNLSNPSLQEYVFSRHIMINADHKAAYLSQEDSLMEVNKLTSSCGPRYYISADTICDSINCDSLCYQTYTFEYNDSLFYTDDLGNTYREIGGGVFEWVEDPNTTKASWLENSASAPWVLEIDSCKISCLEFKDTNNVGGIRDFFANDRCDLSFQAMVIDMRPNGQYLDNTPGDFVYLDSGLVQQISCDSLFCYYFNVGQLGLDTNIVYDSLALIRTIGTWTDTIFILNHSFSSLDELCLDSRLQFSPAIGSVYNITNGTWSSNSGTFEGLKLASVVCHPKNPVTKSPLPLSGLQDFNTWAGTSFADWEDLLLAWSDSFESQIVQYHPEYCAYEFFCNYNFSCGGNTFHMDDLNLYLGQMHSALNYSNASSFSSSGTTYNFLNPLGLVYANPGGSDKSTYIKESPLGKDPLFSCLSGSSTDFSKYAYDSLNYYLTHFIEVFDSHGIATGDYFSLWYLLDDPDSLADGHSGGYNGDLNSGIVALFNAFHGDGNCLEGIISTNDDKYFFFTSIYTFYREKVISDWFSNYYLCEDGNLYTYWDGDTNYDGVLDSSRYVLIYPKVPLYDFHFEGDDNPAINTIKNRVDGLTSPYVASSRDTCSQQKFMTWVYSLEISQVNQQIADSLNANFCTYFTAGQVDSLISASTYGSYEYVNFLPDSLKCSFSENLLFQVVESCSDNLAKSAREAADARWDIDKNYYLDSLSKAYDKTALDSLNKIETVELEYTLGEYHYTLYYYDQAGNLVKTIPPAGVNPLGNNDIAATQNHRDSLGSYTRPSHDYVTLYTYNTQNQLVEQSTPDGGTTKFWYDKAARLIASQNAKQANMHPVAYSYSLYDGLSRIVESGEFQLSSGHSNDLLHDSISSKYDRFRHWLSYGSRKEITFTLYDRELGSMPGAKSTHQEISEAFGSDGQRYLRNRVASTMYVESIGEDTLPYNVNGELNNAGLLAYHKYKNATHYSYDPHGNVEMLIQEIPALAGAPWNRRFFTIKYDYDLVSGNVNEVAYQEGFKDAFYHRYKYDADNRIQKVETSIDRVIWEKEASYYYYPHGPLSRAEIGDQNIQGLDYAYTIQGWLKAVNGSSLGDDPGEFDFGRDAHPSLGENDLFGRDAFAFSLHYFEDDYQPLTNQNAIQKEVGSTFLGINTLDLFNGNISKMVVAMMDNNQNPLKVSANTYKYDQLNRIKLFKSFSDASFSADNIIIGTEVSLGNSAQYSYDPNGNLLSLNRIGNNIEMDNLSYNYDLYTPNVGKRNRLLQVEDDSILSANFTTDIDDQLANFDSTQTGNPAFNNYRYDEIGNLISDKAEGIDLIEWMVSGKVKNIQRATSGATGTNLKFEYDALGNRIRKVNQVDIQNSNSWKSTWYVRDASGNVMSVYEQDSANLVVKEQHLYGSDRLGLKLADNTRADPTSFSSFNLSLNPWEGYQIYPLDEENFTINITGDYELYLKCLEGEILIEAEDITILSGIYEVVSGVGFKLYPGNSISFKSGAITGSWNLETEFPFEISSSKPGFLEDGNYTMIQLDHELERNLGDKRYELKNHLGNVHAVITDRKLQVEDPNNLGTVDYYTSNVTSYTDYYPFGMEIGSRTGHSSEGFRYGFNGKEQDPEWTGQGNIYDYGFRIYNPRIARFLSVDPLSTKYPFYTPYQFAGNKPIRFIDLDGLEEYDIMLSEDNRLAKIKVTRSESRITRFPQLYRYNGQMVGNVNDLKGISQSIKDQLIDNIKTVNEEGIDIRTFVLDQPDESKNEASSPAPISTLTLNISFKGNSDVFSKKDESLVEIGKLAKQLKENPDFQVLLLGNSGTAAGNPTGEVLGSGEDAMNYPAKLNGEATTTRALLVARARAVENILIKDFDIDSARLKVGSGTVIDDPSGRNVKAILKK